MSKILSLHSSLQGRLLNCPQAAHIPAHSGRSNSRNQTPHSRRYKAPEWLLELLQTWQLCEARVYCTPPLSSVSSPRTDRAAHNWPLCTMTATCQSLPDRFSPLCYCAVAF